jgi:hypothetical protein
MASYSRHLSQELQILFRGYYSKLSDNSHVKLYPCSYLLCFIPGGLNAIIQSLTQQLIEIPKQGRKSQIF